ncbi:MAG: hypothetical protein LBE91_08485 [Tannerella sp.]|jgi:hypothetical protein|nr:hypothetical protein [Tannerella sp.]
MNNFREAVLYMLSQMDEDFQRKNEFLIKSELRRYPCLVLMREDLSGYLENEYRGNITQKQKENALDYIAKLDDEDLQNIAYKLESEPMLESFWISIDCWFDNFFEK